MAEESNTTTALASATAQVLPFKRPPKRDADGALYVPPATLTRGTVYVFYGKPRAKLRKPRWHIVIEFCDSTYDHEEGPADWETAMFLARCRATKYGFRVSDLSDTEYCGFAKSKGLRS